MWRNGADKISQWFKFTRCKVLLSANRNAFEFIMPWVPRDYELHTCVCVAKSEFASLREGIRAFLTDWYDVSVQEKRLEDSIVLFSLQFCQLFTGHLSSGIAQLLICECKIWFADMFNLIETAPYLNCKYGRPCLGRSRVSTAGCWHSASSFVDAREEICEVSHTWR
jgi:hypothetical protein